MALMQENAHYKLNSDPGVMNKLNRVHAWIQEFLSGGGGGGVINLFYSLQGGSNGFITEGRRGSNFFQGVSKETDITCDYPGGVRTP